MLRLCGKLQRIFKCNLMNKKIGAQNQKISSIRQSPIELKTTTISGRFKVYLNIEAGQVPNKTKKLIDETT